eukprot:1220304-Prymnesium_polylepis.1
MLLRHRLRRRKRAHGQGMVRGWPGDGQGSGVKSERSLQRGQHAVDLQAGGQRLGPVVADL